MKSNNVRKLTLIAIPLILLMIATVTFAVTGTFDLEEVGKIIAGIEKREDRILVVVNGEYEITQNHLDRAVALASATNELSIKEISNNPSLTKEEKEKLLMDCRALSKEEALQILITNRVLLSEASKLGINFTDSNAIDFLSKNDKAYEDILLNGDEETKAEAMKVLNQQESLLKGLGMTKEEYYKKYAIQAVRESFIRSGLTKAFVETLPQNEQENRQISKARFDEYVAKLVAEADIQYK